MSVPSSEAADVASRLVMLDAPAASPRAAASWASLSAWRFCLAGTAAPALLQTVHFGCSNVACDIRCAVGQGAIETVKLSDKRVGDRSDTDGLTKFSKAVRDLFKLSSMWSRLRRIRGGGRSRLWSRSRGS